jgi:hypothetical protein
LKKGLKKAGVEEGEPIMEMVADDQYVNALSASVHGMGRNAAKFPVKIAPNLDDIEPVANILTPPSAVDSFGVFSLGGGTATGFVSVLDKLFRDGNLRPSAYDRDVHKVVMQTESLATAQQITTPAGEVTSTLAQQLQAVKNLDGLRADGYLHTLFFVHQPHMVHSFTVQARNLSKAEIEDNIGKLTAPIRHKELYQTMMTDRALNANRDNQVLNRMIRRVKCWENILRIRSDPYELLSRGGDVDRGDIVARLYDGAVLVPCLRSVASSEELHGKHPDEQHPRTLEQSVRALVQLLPHSRLAPATTDHITGATVVVGISGENTLEQADIDTFVELPAAEALDLETEQVTGFVANNMTPVTIPGSESWLDGFMLLEVDDTVETVGRLNDA